MKSWTHVKPQAPQKTSIFDVCKDQGVPFGVYTDGLFGVPLAKLLYMEGVGKKYHNIESFKKRAHAGTLEKFCFIEPSMFGAEMFGYKRNDDHPPHDVLLAQDFIAKIYEDLRTSPKWRNTLLIVTYDEHGGFFDPKVPGPAPVPDAFSENDPAFAMYGPRVPAVLVSPWIKQGIDDTLYDHTSVLKYLLEKWAPDAMDHLGQRVLKANSLPILENPRTDEFPPILKRTSSGRIGSPQLNRTASSSPPTSRTSSPQMTRTGSPLKFGSPKSPPPSTKEKMNHHSCASVAMKHAGVLKVMRRHISKTIQEKSLHPIAPHTLEGLVERICGQYTCSAESQHVAREMVHKQISVSKVQLKDSWQVLMQQFEIHATCEFLEQTTQCSDALSLQYMRLLKTQSEALAREQHDPAQ